MRSRSPVSGYVSAVLSQSDAPSAHVCPTRTSREVVVALLESMSKWENFCIRIASAVESESERSPAARVKESESAAYKMAVQACRS